MTLLVVLTVVAIALLIAELAVYLFVVGSQLARVATKLEGCAEVVWDIKRNAEPIKSGVDRINSTGRVIAGALPLLYGMAEGIVVCATYEAAPKTESVPARPATQQPYTQPAPSSNRWCSRAPSSAVRS